MWDLSRAEQVVLLHRGNQDHIQLSSGHTTLDPRTLTSSIDTGEVTGPHGFGQKQ